MPPFSLLLFDCDGVLVDSEEIGNRVMVEAVADLGLAIDLAEAIALFRGRRMAECVAVLTERLGRPLPNDFVTEVRARAAEAFRNELQPIPGIHAALDQISHPRCVVSNGPPAQITLSLTVTGLLRHFEGRLFSAYDAQKWKPDPALYLHAAAACGATADECAVIEDSHIGVTAGLGAGMTVFAYAPDRDHAAELEALGAMPFSNMSELPALVNLASPH